MIFHNVPVIKTSGRWQTRKGGAVRLTIELHTRQDLELWTKLNALQGHKLPQLTLLTNADVPADLQAPDVATPPSPRQAGAPPVGDGEADATPALPQTSRPSGAPPPASRGKPRSGPKTATTANTPVNGLCGWHEQKDDEGNTVRRRFCTQIEGHYPVHPDGSPAHTWREPAATS